MIIRSPTPRSLFFLFPSPLLPILLSSHYPTLRRSLHHAGRKPDPPPSPTPFVPDSKTFLSLIGRSMVKLAPKFPTWESIFTPTSPELRAMGVEPARQRRYLLRWRDKFQKGEFGIGGDLKHVVDGVGELRVIEVPRNDGKMIATATTSPGMKKIIANVPPGATVPTEPLNTVRKVEHVSIHMGNRIKGSHVQYVAGSNYTVAKIQVKEGLWEHKRGRKVDGGERRQAEVRAKRRAEEKRLQRS